ncbi:hypothetical protein DFH29DRAFT_809241 [Suillus ampliporus]|nr:hypothetical protein DFH29DRAFT_809241 [Suillus ampliporus]
MEFADLSNEVEREDASANVDEELPDNEDGWVDEVALLDQDERIELQRDIQPVKLVLLKLCKLSYKLINSTTILLPAWRKILLDLQMTPTNMPRDVCTRWNSTFDMLDYAVVHREVIDTVTQRRDLGLRKFELVDSDWEIVSQLQDVLKLTDKSEVYWIAMVLHPCHKLAYFKNAQWEDAWIETAATLVRDEFERSYLEVGIQENGDDIEVSNTTAHEVCVFPYFCTAH